MLITWQYLLKLSFFLILIIIFILLISEEHSFPLSAKTPWKFLGDALLVEFDIFLLYSVVPVKRKLFFSKTYLPARATNE